LDKLDLGERDLDLREFKEDLSKLCEGEEIGIEVFLPLL